jgi:serine/threonine protein kinase
MDEETLVLETPGKADGSAPFRIGKYSIVKLLGRGGMGTVYLGKDPHLDRFVAIKTLLPLPKNAPKGAKVEVLQRFLREAKSIAQLNHPNVVSIYSIGRNEQSLYLAMEFLDGATFFQLAKSGPPIPLETKISDILQICEGLNAIHEAGLVHRDVKPGNIMKTKDGVVKIMDFGAVHTLDSELTSDEQLIGTPSYMSPEQLQYEHLDKRADIFSLGAVIYYYLTGEKPFPGESFTSVSYKISHETPIAPSKLNPTLPKALDSVILKALAKTPTERYSSCKELAADLSKVMSGRGGAASKSRRSLLIGLAAFLAVAALGVGGFFLAPQTARVALLRGLGLNAPSEPVLEKKKPSAPPLAFQLNYLYLPNPDAEIRRLRNGESLTSNSSFKIVFTPAEDCYVYILRIDRGLDVIRLFPVSGPIYSSNGVAQYANPTKAGQTYVLPSPDEAYSLEQISGRQEIVFAATRTLDAPLASALKILENAVQEKQEKVSAIYRFKTRMLLKRKEVTDQASQLSMPIRWAKSGEQSSFQQQRLDNFYEDCVHRLTFMVH